MKKKIKDLTLEECKSICVKAVMISVKPKWCAKIMNGEKTIEVRRNKALANAIKKLIDEYGYADIYVYCSKDSKQRLYPVSLLDKSNQVFKRAYRETKIDNRTNYLNGKVPFKFRCYKVDDYVNGRKWSWKVGAPMWGACNDYEYILKDTCLTDDELRNYADDLSFYAIHISHLEIFDKPKELSEFKQPRDSYGKVNWNTNDYYYMNLTKAPQNMVYVEVE
jgi:predicted transcriptional regulator